MKKITILLCLTVVLTSCLSYKTVAVDLDTTVSQISVEGNKNDLFVRANNWMVENFVDAKSVIQFTDKESGTVTGKYLMYNRPASVSMGIQSPGVEIFAIIKIQVKDGAAKLSINPSEFGEIQTSNKTYQALYYTKEKAEQEVNQLVTSFGKYMNDKESDF